jgi:nitrite reductase (NADH) small subunit
MTETRRWVRTARCQDIPLREGRSVKLGEREIAIFNLGDRFLAVSSHCPHRNGPLAEGIISGHSVVCPLHAWKVDLETGAVTRPSDSPVCVERFQVRIEDGIVLVELPVEPSQALESRGHYRDGQDVLPLMRPSCLPVEETEIGNIGM